MITMSQFHLPARNADPSIAGTWLRFFIGVYIALFSLFLLFTVVLLNHYFFVPPFNNILFFPILLFPAAS